MKRTDLEKLQGKQLTGRMRSASVPDRFGKDASPSIDKREQRRRDAAAGLIPFATKLPSDLVRQLREEAEREGVPLNAWVGILLGEARAARVKKGA
jgi:hypothetical protein